MAATPDHITRILAIATARAQRLGIPREESEDCAAAFVGHLALTQPHILTAGMAAPRAEAWLRTCVDNWVLNALKRHRSISRRCVGMEEQSAFLEDGRAGTETTPSGAVLRDELITRLLAAVATLRPAQQELFVRRFLQEEPIEDIAAATGRSRDAIRQGLTAIRRQVRKQLLASGLDEAEARAYIADVLPRS